MPPSSCTACSLKRWLGVAPTVEMTETYLRGAKATAKLAEFDASANAAVADLDGRRVVILEFTTPDDHVAIEIGVDEVRQMYATLEDGLKAIGW